MLARHWKAAGGWNKHGSTPGMMKEEMVSPTRMVAAQGA